MLAGRKIFFRGPHAIHEKKVLVGRIWAAGRSLPTPGIAKLNKLNNI